jgi:uncharacterized glyoxalase superfamily protein PhnB
MEPTVTPMIHVPDVQTTVDWYKSIGFTVLDVGEVCGEVVFGLVSFGVGRVMFSAGGQPSTSERREVDLYIQVNDVDELHEDLKDRVEVRVGLNDTFYGMREFTIRDLNGFWITFGQRGVER